MARISPLLGFMTMAAVILLPVEVCHSSMYFWTIFWMFTSMVDTTVLPLTAGLITPSKLAFSSR